MARDATGSISISCRARHTSEGENTSLRILAVTSEMMPYAKTGGLADVAGALPKALAALGHDVAVALPFYGSIDRDRFAAEIAISEVPVLLPAGARALRIWLTLLPGTESLPYPVKVYLVEDPGLFARREFYVEGGLEYPDNALRFAYFCQAALRMLRPLEWMPDVIQCNDWQSACVPLYLAHDPGLAGDPELGTVPVLFSIHNLNYQGLYHAGMLGPLGFPRSAYTAGELEYYGQINLLKGALVNSDAITTVSEQYAREIQTPEFGAGLEGVLIGLKDRLTGILNGIDPEEWNPAADPHIPGAFDAEDPSGKALCKAELQAEMGLEIAEKLPLMGLISRLIDQKGLDLLEEALPPVLMEGDVQFVLLGTGEPRYEEFFLRLAETFPGQVAVQIGFNNGLAHRIEAGCDIFLMPSRYEPCGLNQMYSLRYGTVPLVRRTGGLADSVVEATTENIVSGEGTGFVFEEYDAVELGATMISALRLYHGAPELWAQLVRNGMRQDFSWGRSARAYERIFRQIAG